MIKTAKKWIQKYPQIDGFIVLLLGAILSPFFSEVYTLFHNGTLSFFSLPLWETIGVSILSGSYICFLSPNVKAAKRARTEVHEQVNKALGDKIVSLIEKAESVDQLSHITANYVQLQTNLNSLDDVKVPE